MVYKKFIQRLTVFFAWFLMIQQTTYAQAGIDWTSQASAADNGWRSVTWGEGLFVAVSNSGAGNRVMTSPDGITWTSQISAADNPWNSVTYGNGVFVAVSSVGVNRVMISPDGINWTALPSVTNIAWRSVTWGAGLFVAVSNSGVGNRVMTSSDGITWTSRSSAADNSWNAITYGNGLFVAGSTTGAGNRIMTSPDGINWTSQASAADLGWNSIIYAAGLFVAVAGSGGAGSGVMTSIDGINWTSQIPAADNGWNSVTYGNGLFVAVSNTGIGELVMTSPDGINWTSRAPGAIKNWVGITYSNGLFVAVSTAGAGLRVMTSGTFVVLPLHWLSINGTINIHKQAQINWQVTEQNVSSYEIEKSNNAINYSSIGSISSKGNGENIYSFTEMEPLTTSAWYRIKQTDIDGRSSYSSIIMLRNSNRQQVSIYPNPVTDLVTVVVGNDLLNKNVALSDLSGKLLQTIKISSLSFTINMTGYPTGIYLMRTGNESPVKIVKE